jgi:hypothetical protein
VVRLRHAGRDLEPIQTQRELPPCAHVRYMRSLQVHVPAARAGRMQDRQGADPGVSYLRRVHHSRLRRNLTVPTEPVRSRAFRDRVSAAWSVAVEDRPTTPPSSSRCSSEPQLKGQVEHEPDLYGSSLIFGLELRDRLRDRPRDRDRRAQHAIPAAYPESRQVEAMQDAPPTGAPVAPKRALVSVTKLGLPFVLGDGLRGFSQSPDQSITRVGW